MRALVVALPQPPQAQLSAHIPDLKVHVREGDGGEVLANGRDGVASGSGRLGIARGGEGVEGFDLREEGRFARIVEAEEEDGIFCREPG